MKTEFEFRITNISAIVGPNVARGSVELRKLRLVNKWSAAIPGGDAHLSDDKVGAALKAIGAEYGLKVIIK